MFTYTLDLFSFFFFFTYDIILVAAITPPHLIITNCIALCDILCYFLYEKKIYANAVER